MPPGSSQRKLAMRLPRDAEDGDSIASETGTENLVRAFRASLGTQIVNDVGEKTDQYFYGGTGRGPLSRKTGQSMSQWIEAEEDAYHEMLKSYKAICPDLKDILPSEVRGGAAVAQLRVERERAINDLYSTQWTVGDCTSDQAFEGELDRQ